MVAFTLIWVPTVAVYNLVKDSINGVCHFSQIMCLHFGI